MLPLNLDILPERCTVSSVQIRNCTIIRKRLFDAARRKCALVPEQADGAFVQADGMSANPVELLASKGLRRGRVTK